MRVDFYQLTRDPAEAVIPLIARATLGAGERLLVVSADPAQRERIGEALWARLPESFLAHGGLNQPHAARQPILLAAEVVPTNGARFIAVADGVWREAAEGFARAFLLFAPDRLEPARALWRALGENADTERRFWKQDDGRWREGP